MSTKKQKRERLQKAREETAKREFKYTTAQTLIGIFALAAALEGYCFANMNAVIRIVIAAGGLLLSQYQQRSRRFIGNPLCLGIG